MITSDSAQVTLVMHGSVTFNIRLTVALIVWRVRGGGVSWRKLPSVSVRLTSQTGNMYVAPEVQFGAHNSGRIPYLTNS